MTRPALPPERWKQVTAITAEALEREHSDRAVWIEAACAGDLELRREVESLLAAAVSAGEFLETAAIAREGAAEAVAAAARESLGLVEGRRVGPYRVIKELGHGGMGVVYLAARADLAFDKQVAIKIVRGGPDRDVALSRFSDERRILATLDHANIARLLDGGVTVDGLSYVVMEYVDGVPIHDYCETARLSLKQRLELFLQVCAAVQYAHQRLVIHRDIKPRNILVTGDGTPKLLDFGIAKLLHHDAGDDQTRTGLRRFTLEYASPEQIRGESMSVTSDVYALGVLLYQLVTGHLPYGAADLPESDMVRAVCDRAPVRPDLTAQRGTRFRIGTELEWVLLKALRKEPDRRYQSVEQFVDDLDRLLTARPVSAGPDSRRYRARKFVTRHRASVAAAGLVTVSLVSGLMATLWQAQRAQEQRARAEQRFQNARRLANSMVFELNDALESGSTTARALLLMRASEQLDALSREAPDDPELAEELAVAYHRLGVVQGQTSRAHLGDRPAARASHRKGLALRRAVVERAPHDLDAKLRLATSLIDAAEAEDEVGPSFEHARAAVQIMSSLVEARPRDSRVRRVLATAHYTLGAQHRAVGETALALESFERATPLFQSVYDANPADADVRRLLALCHKRLGAILSAQDPPRALPHLRHAIALDEASLEQSPLATQPRRDLSTSNIELGFGLRRVGDAQGALAAYRRALALRESMLRDDAGNRQAPHDVASALFYIGDLQNEMGAHAEATASLQRALPLSAPLRPYDELQALIITALADSFEGRGRLAEALPLRIRARDELRAMADAQPASKSLRRLLVKNEVELAETLTRFSEQKADPRQKRAACIEYEEAARVLAGLGANAERELPSVTIAERLRNGIGTCEERVTDGR